MTTLVAEELDFARRHLERFDDTDFYPSLPEYQAIWADWGNVVDRLVPDQIRRLPISPATAMPVAKGRLSYRIVHQLDPITSLAYNSLVYRVAPDLEAGRAANEIACSNRFQPVDGAFFGAGLGYEEYRRRSQELCGRFQFAAAVDVADFYNQIYSHRVRASIEASRNGLFEVARDVEALVHSINSGASKGIPVGCDASAILGEGIMIDVDQLISRVGVVHTRYVDDIRLFANDAQSLHTAVETLSDYLYDHHRLHLNSSKTRLLPSADFLERVVLDHSDAETAAAMHMLGLMDPYGDAGFDEDDVPDEAILGEIGAVVDAQFRREGLVDLNLLKALIRRARRAEWHGLIPVAVAALDAFIPVIHELSKAAEAMARNGHGENVLPLIYALRASPHYRRRAVRLWTDWLSAGTAVFLADLEIRAAVFQSGMRTQARAAMTLRDLAWIRAQRGTFAQLPQMERSAVALSMQLLGNDEREHLLRQMAGAGETVLDAAVRRWVAAQ